jgi:outer membrane autotransporter protein
MLVTTYVAVWANYDTLGTVFTRLEWIASTRSRVWYAGIGGRFDRVARASPEHGASLEPALADADSQVQRDLPDAMVHGHASGLPLYASTESRARGRTRRLDKSIIASLEEIVATHERDLARASGMQAAAERASSDPAIVASNEEYARTEAVDDHSSTATIDRISSLWPAVVHADAVSGRNYPNDNGSMNSASDDQDDSENATVERGSFSVMLVSVGALLVHKFGGHGLHASKIATGYGRSGDFRKVDARVMVPVDEIGARNETGAANEQAAALPNARARTRALHSGVISTASDINAVSGDASAGTGNPFPSSQMNMLASAMPTDLLATGIAGSSPGVAMSITGNPSVRGIGITALNSVGATSFPGMVEATGGPIGVLPLAVNAANAHLNGMTLSGETGSAPLVVPFVSGTVGTTGTMVPISGVTVATGSTSTTGTTSANSSTPLNGTTPLSGTVVTVASEKSAQSSLSGPSSTIGAIKNDAPVPVLQASRNVQTRQMPVVLPGTSIYSSLGSSLALSAQSTNTALLDRLGDSPADKGGRPGSWIDIDGVQTRLNSTAGVPGFEVHQYGFMGGVDRSAGSSTVGVAAGYSHADVGEQQTGDAGTTDTLRMALYGSHWLGRAQVSATLGYGLDFLSQSRPFAQGDTATGDHIGQEVTAAAQASLPIAVGGVTITPRLGLRYAYFHGNGFDEQGAGNRDLSVGTDNVRSLQPYVETTFDKTFGTDLAPVKVQLRLGYAQELLDTNRTMTVGLQNGPSFVAPGVALPRGELTTGLSVSMQASKATTILLSYDALINTGHASSQAADIRLDYRF